MTSSSPSSSQITIRSSSLVTSSLALLWEWGWNRPAPSSSLSSSLLSRAFTALWEKARGRWCCPACPSARGDVQLGPTPFGSGPWDAELPSEERTSLIFRQFSFTPRRPTNTHTYKQTPTRTCAFRHAALASFFCPWSSPALRQRLPPVFVAPFPIGVSPEVCLFHL